MQSLHVPATTVQRVARFVKWVLPAIGACVSAAWASYQWVLSQADVIAEANTAAKAAQSDAHHGSSIADGHVTELRALWAHVVAMRAELRVLRAYSKLDAKTRGEYIDKAQAYYALRLDEQLRQHANDPALAAELALKSEWRPDR